MNTLLLIETIFVVVLLLPYFCNNLYIKVRHDC